MNIQSARFAFLLSALSLSAVSSGGIEICPSISLGIDNPAPVCSMESMTVGAWFTELPGLCREVPVTYLDKQWTWVVEGVEATPSSGKGSSATFTNITGGEGSITFALRCRVRACEDCNTTLAITTNFTAIKVDVAESNVVLCSYDTSATLSLTGDSYSPSGFVWNSTLWKKSKDGASVSFDPSTKPPGIYTVRASSRSRSACSDVCQVSIVRVDLDVDSNLDGVCDEADELFEDGSGRLVGVNNDDDNANGTNDLDEAGVVVGENDLVPIYLRVEPTMPTGAVILDAPSGGDKIKVWKTASKDQEVHLPMTWHLGAGTVPEVRYIEGIHASDHVGDVRLRLQYQSGAVDCSDEISVSVLKVEFAMDGNRDDSISFDSTNDNHYLFWVNDDVDVISGGEEDDAQSGTANCNDSAITCKRDLEDFARLHIKVDDNTANLSGITYFLKFENVSSGSPSVNIFKAVDESSAYLSDTNVANQQIQKTNLLTATATEQQLPNEYIKAGNQISPFILEGKSAGKGDLTLVVKKDGNEVCKKAVALDLRRITEFYEKYVVTIIADDNVNTTSGGNANSTTYTPENDEYVLHVHGWNMQDWEKDRWTETVFKRLWWQRYKGHVGGFQWPTYTGTLTYDASEIRAWRSGQALNNRITSLNSSYSGQIRVLAHSMGNVVMGEALRLFSSSVVNTYIAAQAAIPAYCYDSAVSDYWTGFDTPNIYAHYSSGLSPDTPYLVANSSHAGAMVTYFNTNDYALGWWETGNEMKPDFNYWYTEGDANVDSYAPGAGDRFFCDSVLPFDERTMTIPDDRFEIFARIVESRSRALGREVSVAGFGTARNLKDWGYNDQHYSHSREFRSNVADEWSFWNTFFGDAGITR